MASAVTSKCFSTPNRCDNCSRKLCDKYTKDKKVDIQYKAKASETEHKLKSESSSGRDEKGNLENNKCKADDTPKTKLPNDKDKELGNPVFKSKGDCSSKQEIRKNTKKENCEVNDKLGGKGHKTKSKEDGKESSKTELRFKSENCNGKDEKGNTEGRKCNTDDKRENIDSKAKPKSDNDDSDDRKVFKRCTGCFLMTYCDKTCQKEHWIRVHKYHCAYLSGKKVSNEHQENSCKDCIASETASRDELLYINSPKIGCRIKVESNRMRRELGALFGFHGDGHFCTCGNQFSCEHPFPMGKIQGSAIATGMDEMIVHAAKLSNAFIIKGIKANEKKDIIDRLLVLHNSILDSRVMLWCQILVYGDVPGNQQFTDLFIEFGRDVRDKVDIENPWWKSLNFSLSCIYKMAQSRDYIQLAESEITDTKLIGNYDYHQKIVKNVSMITKNNLWHRFKLWPSTINNSLGLRLPNDVFCFSCNADLSGQVVGLLNAWKPSNLYPSLFGVVGNNEGVIATCSSFRNFDCGKGYCIKTNTHEITDEEKHLYQTLAKNTRICHMCLKMSSTSHRCTKCWAAQYCSKDCQEEDWNNFHQTVCSTWVEDPTRRLMSSQNQKEVTKEHVEKSYKTWLKKT